ncbi:MAG: hypothetical protein JXB47_15120 [Anaerolineae bacterium]|nr:hypothetical protein [Anaerolineae bacterium]
MNTDARPRRPYGLSLMIIACTLVYVVLPLVGVLYPLVLALVLDTEFQQDATVGAGQDYGSAGARLGGAGALQIVFSLVFAVVMVIAWRGRRRWVRWAVVGLVFFQAAAVLVNGVQILNSAPTNSAEQLTKDAQPVMMVGASLLALFVSWYFSRAPAVAFFTGEPVKYIEEEEKET